MWEFEFSLTRILACLTSSYSICVTVPLIKRKLKKTDSNKWVSTTSSEHELPAQWIK